MLLTFSIAVSKSNDSTGVYFIGHSLVSTWQGYESNVVADLSKMVSALASDAGYSTFGAKQAPPGTGLKANFTTATGNTPWDVNAESGRFDYLILTEALELRSNLKWNEGSHYASEFHKSFSKVNPEIETLIYMSWHCVEAENCTYDNTGINFISETKSYLSDWEKWLMKLQLLYRKIRFV